MIVPSMIVPLVTVSLVAASLVAGCTSGADGGEDAGEVMPPSSEAGSDDGDGEFSSLDDLLPADCADIPDPDVFVDGQVPTVIPPCVVPDELVVHTIRPGTGSVAADGDTVYVDYIGMIIGSGQVFDTSYTRGRPLDFPLGRGGVIAGWDEGLVGARNGSLLRLDIPNDLAYGDSPPGDQIEPGDSLSFLVEIRAVIPPTVASDAPLDIEVEPSVGALGLTTDDLVVGDGETIEAGDTAIVHMLLVRGDNEVVLFNTWERGEPLEIPLEDGQTLPGVLEGLDGVTVGTRRVMAMPPALAFGDAGEPSLGLPADTDLIVVVDVVGAY